MRNPHIMGDVYIKMNSIALHEKLNENVGRLFDYKKWCEPLFKKCVNLIVMQKRIILTHNDA